VLALPSIGTESNGMQREIITGSWENVGYRFNVQKMKVIKYNLISAENRHSERVGHSEPRNTKHSSPSLYKIL
jgi:hypothetical protein